jgi:hypothetical protein
MPKVEEAAEVQHRFVHLHAGLFPALSFRRRVVLEPAAVEAVYAPGARGIVRRSRGEAKSDQSCGQR